MFDYAVLTYRNCPDAIALDLRKARVRRSETLDTRCNHGFENGFGSADHG
jgi:hypothetical protein